MAPGFELTGSSIVLDVNADVICTITNDDNGDAAQIPPPPAAATTVAILPVTGSSSGSTVLIAGLGVLLGFAMTDFGSPSPHSLSRNQLSTLIAFSWCSYDHY